jgi:hypothetical protein
MKEYTFNKPIFIIATILIATLIIYIGFSEGMLKIEGYHITMFKTETISCDAGHLPNGWCDIILYNGTQIKLQVGETITTNQFNTNKINTANYGTLLILLISLGLNHYIYNRKK